MKQKDSTNIRIIIAVLTGVICIILFYRTLQILQDRYMLKTTQVEMRENSKYIEEVSGTESSITETMHSGQGLLMEEYMDLLLFLRQNDTQFAMTDSYLYNLFINALANDILIVDKDGNVIASAIGNHSKQDEYICETLAEAMESDEVFETGIVPDSETLQLVHKESVDDDEINQVLDAWDYYETCYIRRIDRRYAFIYKTSSIQQMLLEEPGKIWNTILSNERIGVNGYALAWSDETEMLLYAPSEEMIDTPVSKVLPDVETFKNDTFCWTTFDGEEIYLYPHYIEDSQTWIGCAVPAKDLRGSRMVVRFAVWLVFALSVIDLILYVVLLLRQKKVWMLADFTKSGKPMSHPARQYKLFMFTVLLTLLVLILSFYLQSLYLMSSWGDSSREQLLQIEKNLDNNKAYAENYFQYYISNKSSQISMLSNFFAHNEDQITDDTIEETAGILNLSICEVVSADGKVRASRTDPSLHASGSVDYEEANRKMYGDEDVTDVFKTIGQSIPLSTAIYLDDGTREGDLRATFTSELLDSIIGYFTVTCSLDLVQPGEGAFVFSVDSASGKFTYFPDEKKTGKKATDHGIEKNELREGLYDFIVIDGVTYYGTSIERGTDLIFLVISKSNLLRQRLPISAASAGTAFLMFLLIGLSLYTSREQVEQIEPDDADGIGHFKGTSPEMIVFRVMGYYVAIGAVLFTVYATLRPVGLSISVLNYIADGNWEYGFNVFALTAAILMFCQGGTALFIVRKFVYALAGILPIRGGTIIRMLTSLLTYVGFFLLGYQAMIFFGMQPTALIASAGIVSVVFGIGANSLVGDIIAGIFLLMEGNIHIGDMVQVDDFKGYVQEMGIRMTLLFNVETEDVKIIPNKEVQNVVHLSMHPAIIYIKFLVGYDEDIARVEELMNHEMKAMKGRVPHMIGEPKYLGVYALDNDGVTLYVAARCHEAFRPGVERGVIREVYLMFNRNGIEVPYPQLTLHEANDAAPDMDGLHMQGQGIRPSSEDSEKGKNPPA